ncbi:hypothetical protein FDC22_01325 [Clostridium botulinum]|uniref:Uncharacterized protein n=1 Tax=Clostridium botulinum (strain Okra / Type B1) TaxID=498213 RepID=B1IGQ0_CLOBK|nr:hypothetical protein [Clostridium botulinum]EKX80471.1 hypothetical protein CFSAN001628_006659 [Clostridium botulinum CFSAN001628]ACA45419.1 conserved hypothetical protein [Clostridium botulinum B1 str. Okra]MBD5564028.1 hypothetical protein [Clostridium botulinum]MBD5566601.1 hypothetical protein [Clostridium botulinum]MBD5568883.1 hypothetical protein [Clostridium botulinum]
MNKEKWQEEADELVDAILDLKEKGKRDKEDLDSLKMELVDLLESKNINEFVGKNGKANFVDFEREGLVKENVVETVDGVNKGRIKNINMRDLTKDIKVHFINVRGYLGD